MKIAGLTKVTFSSVLAALLLCPTAASSEKLRFNKPEKSAVVNILLGKNLPGEVHLDWMIRWQEVMPVFHIVSDESGFASDYLEEFVSEVQMHEALGATISNQKVNVLLVVSEDIVAAAREHREVFSMFFVGDTEAERLAKADEFIELQSNENGFMQIGFGSAEEGIAGAMMFLKSSENAYAVRSRIAAFCMRALGFLGSSNPGVPSVLSKVQPTDWLSDFDLRLIEFVYAGNVNSGDGAEEILEALGGY